MNRERVRHTINASQGIGQGQYSWLNMSFKSIFLTITA
jgi:hypothetical protein